MVRRRRLRGADHALAAQGTERPCRVGRGVQSAVHDARDDDDLPRRHAALGGVLQFSDSAADRRARRRIPAAQRVQLLGVSVRFVVHELVVARRDGAERRLVRLRSAHDAAVFAGHEHRLLDARSSDPRRVVARRGVQFHHDDHQHARAGNEPDAHADVHVDGVRRAVPVRAGVPGDHDRAGVPAVRSLLRHELLHDHRRRRPAPLAALVLDLRTPGGLHPDSAGVRSRLRDSADILAQADFRISGHGLFRNPHRLPRIRRMGAPHVRGRNGRRSPTRCSRRRRCSSRFRPA